MKQSLFTLFVVLLAVLQVNAYKKDEKVYVKVNNKDRNIVVFTPNKMEENMPLFIVTHGMNQNPEYQYGSDKMYEMIDTAKFVVAYLRSDGNTWDCWGTNDQTFVTKAIDEMYTRYGIDKDRVYWTGFSMGSMLLHSSIGNMQNKIAAFAPTSGIMQNSTPWNNCKKPVNLLEVIAYGDSTFKYKEYNIHSYIENYAKHDKHTRYSKTIGYKAKTGNWQDGDLEKWTGGPNGGEVWLFSYNSGGHWPSDQNRFLIWNFCKRFTLNQPTARISVPDGETTHVCMAPKGSFQFPDITMTATAKAALTTGKIEKVAFYDGSTLVDTKTAAPYEAVITAPKAGTHTLRVEATDDKGKTGEYSCTVNYTESASSYNFYTRFRSENIVPQDWYVSSGSTKRIGGGLAVTSGNRTLRFTNGTRAFEYGLLVQNAQGKEKVAWAKFGDPKGRSTLTLNYGHYALKFKICSWNQPTPKPVTIAIEKVDGTEVASMVYTPTANIGNNVANKFSSSLATFEFDIPETGNYVIVFYADAAKNADFVLGQVNLQAKSFTTGVVPIDNGKWIMDNEAGAWYTVDGVKLNGKPMRKGVYIFNGKKVVMK